MHRIYPIDRSNSLNLQFFLQRRSVGQQAFTCSYTEVFGWCEQINSLPLRSPRLINFPTDIFPRVCNSRRQAEKWEMKLNSNSNISKLVWVKGETVPEGFAGGWKVHPEHQSWVQRGAGGRTLPGTRGWW